MVDIAQGNASAIHSAANSIPALVWITGPDRRCSFVNHAWIQYTGMTAGEDSLHVSWLESISPEDRDRFWAEYSRAFDRRETFRLDFRVRAADNAYHWFRVEGAPHSGPNGAFLGYIGYCFDVDDSKRAEQAWRENQNQLAGIIASAMDAIITIDESQHITMFNAAAERIFRCRAEEAIGQHLDRFIPERFRTAHREHIRFFARTNVTRRHMGMLGAISGLRADGEEFPIEASISQFQVGGQKLFTVILRDITTRRLAEEEMERLLASEKAERETAEAANRMKDEFLSTLSHELRTPLNAILGWAHLLRSGRFDPRTHASGLEAIERNAKAQSQLIEDLLDASRIVMGKIRLDLHVVDLRSAIESAVETARPAARAKGIQLQTILSHEAGPVSGDPNRLQQVFWNLLSNAVKFTPDAGLVEVRLESAGANARITVRDTGKGISADLLPYVFDRFRQGDASATRKHGGLGLGLAIARHLVELHGGTIRVESPGENQGATFTIEFPSAAGPWIADSKNFLGTNPLRGLRVVLVDDEPDFLRLLSLVLSNSGAEVVTCRTALEALSAVESLRPHLVITDIAMPDEDGYALIRKLRAGGSRMPAVAVTGFASGEERDRALSEGFQAFVPKPIDPDELILMLANLAAPRPAVTH